MNIPGSTSETTQKDAKQLLEQGEMRAARELIEKELRTEPNCAELLAMLADVEFADGNVMAGQKRLADAAKASGWNAEFTARRIRVLGLNGLWSDGLRAVGSIPEEVRHDSQVRAEAGGFYRRCGCPAHAACCYGLRAGPFARVRVARLWCWLLSDGPCARTRRKANKPEEDKANKPEENKAKWEEDKAYKWEEEKLLSWLRQPMGYTDQLDHIPGLQECDARRVRTELGRLQYPRWHLWVRWMAVGRWLYYWQFAAVFVAWPVLIVISRQAGFASGPAGAVFWPLLSAFIATEPVALLAVLLFRPDWEPRGNLTISIGAIFACFVVAGLAVAAVIGAYDKHALPTAGVWSWVVLGALAVPLTLFCYFVGSLFFNLAWLWQLHRLIRKDCPLAVLDVLLFIIDGLRDPLECRHLGQRLNLAAALEFAARRIARDLVPKFYRRYLASGEQLTEQAAQWAEALRQMQRQMVASVPGIPAQTEAALANEIRCLATGDLGALAARALPPRPSRRDRAVSAFRTVLEALLPLVLVLAAQPIVHGILHHTPGPWYWFLIATIIWALLIVLLWLDPGLRDKIETISQMTGLAGRRPGTGP